MNTWHPCTYTEYLEVELRHSRAGKPLVLLSHQHLGNEDEPMDLFIWGDGVTRNPLLRSAVTVNNKLYWRT
ncbi:hypothetical protein D3C87_324100 [compost metagenome]